MKYVVSKSEASATLKPIILKGATEDGVLQNKRGSEPCPTARRLVALPRGVVLPIDSLESAPSLVARKEVGAGVR